MNLSDEQKNTLILTAFKCIGIKYDFGTKATDLNAEPETIKGIDCSGLVRYLLHKVNITIQDGSNNMWEATQPTTDTPQTGDLVFKMSTGVVDHVGMFIQGSMFPPCVIEASGSLGQVVFRDLESFKTFPHGIDFAGIRRIK